MKMLGKKRSATIQTSVPIIAIALALVALFCPKTEAKSIRPEHNADSISDNSYIGGALPRISMAKIYAENKEEPGKYCFKFVVSRVGGDKGKRGKKGKDNPTGKFFINISPHWKDILSFCPKFRKNAIHIWPQLRGKVVPPIRFTVTYKMDYWEVTKKAGKWIPVRQVNWATAFPSDIGKWENVNDRQIRVFQHERRGLAPGYYMVRIWALAKLDQQYLKHVVKRAIKALGVPNLLCAITGWTAKMATDAYARYLLRVPAKVPAVEDMLCSTAMDEIKKRRLQAVARGDLRSGKVTKMGPAAGTWLWKDQKVYLNCGASSKSDPDDNWYGTWRIKSTHTKGPVFEREKNPTRNSVMNITKSGAFPKVVWGGKIVCDEKKIKADKCFVYRNMIIINTHHVTGKSNSITYTFVRKGNKLVNGSKFKGKISGKAAAGTYTGYRVAGSGKKSGHINPAQKIKHPGAHQEREINILEEHSPLGSRN